jgi:hypothetical protein
VAVEVLAAGGAFWASRKLAGGVSHRYAIPNASAPEGRKMGYSFIRTALAFEFTCNLPRLTTQDLYQIPHAFVEQIRRQKNTAASDRRCHPGQRFIPRLRGRSKIIGLRSSEHAVSYPEISSRK